MTPKILVVEDNALVAAALRDLVLDSGYRVAGPGTVESRFEPRIGSIDRT